VISNEFTQPMNDGIPEKGRSLARTAGTIALLLVFQLPLAGYLVPGDSLAAQTGREAVFWVLVANLIAYVLFVERRPISSVGLKRPTWKSIAFGFAAGAIMVAGFAFIYMVIYPAVGLADKQGALEAVKATPLWFRVLVVIRAAVLEELYYRGFMIERLTEITGFRWLAAAISFSIFTIAHLGYWGGAHLIVAAFGGAVLTGLYLFRRDLASNMIAHFLIDGIGFLVG